MYESLYHKKRESKRNHRAPAQQTASVAAVDGCKIKRDGFPSAPILSYNTRTFTSNSDATMKAEVQNLERVFAKEGDKQFIVPAYQRPYRWDADDAVQLLQDVHESCDADETEYFIGSMICIKKSNNKYEVVDGQQRLITLTIILSCLSECIRNSGIKKELKERILRSDPFSKNTTPRATLVVHEREHDFYFNHVLHREYVEEGRSVTEKVYEHNRKDVGEYLKQMEQSGLERLAKHLSRSVSVVFVEVDDFTSAFRLFNVLNNRGMRLNDADLVKNLLLEAVANDEEGSRLVDNSWKVMEEQVGEDELHQFIRMHIVSEKKNRDRVIKIASKKASPYEYYRHQLKNKFDGKSTKMVQILRTSAANYRDILDGKWGADKTIRLLNNLNKPFEWMPAFLAFANKWPGRKGFADFAQMFEKIYMQGWFTTGKRDDACYRAIEAINNDESVDAVIDVIRQRAEDKKFEESLDSSEFYDVTRRQIINFVKAVLICVNDERHDESAKIDVSDKVHVEHILPQNMSANAYWRERFSDDEHAKWVNKLGNLTLLIGRKNSTASNRGFPEKKTAYQAGTIPALSITQEILDYDEWNADSLRARHEKLKREILALWLVRDKHDIFGGS